MEADNTTGHPFKSTTVPVEHSLSSTSLQSPDLTDRMFGSTSTASGAFQDGKASYLYIQPIAVSSDNITEASKAFDGVDQRNSQATLGSSSGSSAFFYHDSTTVSEHVRDRAVQDAIATLNGLNEGMRSIFGGSVNQSNDFLSQGQSTTMVDSAAAQPSWLQGSNHNKFHLHFTGASSSNTIPAFTRTVRQLPQDNHTLRPFKKNGGALDEFSGSDDENGDDGRRARSRPSAPEPTQAAAPRKPLPLPRPRGQGGRPLAPVTRNSKPESETVSTSTQQPSQPPVAPTLSFADGLGVSTLSLANLASLNLTVDASNLRVLPYDFDHQAAKSDIDFGDSYKAVQQTLASQRWDSPDSSKMRRVWKLLLGGGSPQLPNCADTNALLASLGRLYNAVVAARGVLPLVTFVYGSSIQPRTLVQFHQKVGEVFTVGNEEEKLHWVSLGRGEDERAYFRARKVRAGIDGQEIVQVAAGAMHSTILTNSGEVFTCGNGDDGVLGTGKNQTREEESQFTRVLGLDGVFIVKVLNMDSMTLALSDKKEVYSCGAIRLPDGSLRFDRTRKVSYEFRKLQGLPPVLDMSGPYSFGYWGDGRLGRSFTMDDFYVPKPMHTGDDLLGGPSAVACGDAHTILFYPHRNYSFGNNSHGQLGTKADPRPPRPQPQDESSLNSLQPIRMAPVQNKENPASNIDRGFNKFVKWVKKQTRKVKDYIGGVEGYTRPPCEDTVGATGHECDGSSGGPPRLMRHPKFNFKVAAASAGDMHTVVADTRGNVYTFGDNTDGQCGVTILNLQNASIDHEPQRVEGVTKVTSVSAISCHTVEVTSDPNNNAWMWGESGTQEFMGDEKYDPNEPSAISEEMKRRPMRLNLNDRKVIQMEPGNFHTIMLLGPKKEAVGNGDVDGDKAKGCDDGMVDGGDETPLISGTKEIKWLNVQVGKVYGKVKIRAKFSRRYYGRF
ncbi:hypothetical protein HDU76_000213 [Blyttiomyces sp. JEL0837]|nr:hypothetical protein HDU76_000213 [Blyttiomyces sp. JEL0837]